MIENELAQLTKKVTDDLQKHQLTLATAESCTGGGLSYWLTFFSGSAAWFDRGFITYSNAAKIQLLNISSNLLDQYGAVSEEAALAMAEGALNNSNADIGISVTGIAGPTGGSEKKPIGTVYFAYADQKNFRFTHQANLCGDRENIRKNAIFTALSLLKNWLSPI